ncbi:cation-transporting P-type ATPase [Novispirillum sp. DQ9]|uniref:cation-transporting P-type ATPase n=1 Tax=Novispirillum sp. DQ9 TaxID=3398612 RepID=UPI003C798382
MARPQDTLARPPQAAAPLSPAASGDICWHARTADDALAALAATAHGLEDAEAARRRATHGANRLPQGKPRSPWLRFAAQFNNLLIQVLLGAAAVTAVLGHWIDTAVIVAVVLLNAVIGFVQEGRAEKALEAIRDMLAPRAAVLRGGHRVSLPAEDLVPGDVVLLEPGDRVPADLRLLAARGLAVQEAALTGEAVPVDKTVDPVAADAALGDRSGMAYSGTMVTTGTGRGLVIATGAATELGRISAMIGAVESLTTPLIRQMEQFARWLTGAILVIAVAAYAYGVLLGGFGPAEMFMVVVGLAVAAIPEGLPAILTVTLAIGVRRMAGRNAIIRRLPAVETLGSVSIICSDKTGTLTRNEMMVRAVALPDGTCMADGEGYDPHGTFTTDDGAEVDADRLAGLARAAALCNDAQLRRGDDDAWSVEGDPMEGALLVAAMKAGLDLDHERRTFPRVDAIPFDSAHRYMATLHHDHSDGGARAVVFLKGAPERLIALCGADEAAWSRRVDALAGQGQRVLALARLEMPAGTTALGQTALEDGACGQPELLGLVGMIDPPREEAIVAVAECRSAGVRVKMITGDHGTTARAIGAHLGLANARDVLTGPELDGIDDAALVQRAAEVDVFARTSPQQKLRLVTALQAGGQVVAMTGDGVNDAPALKRADVGVAMGKGGTEAAKEASEMVLADDNFASIASAVREGRTVYDNLKKAILFLLPVNGGESLAILAAIVAGTTLPITPLQILWVNMVSSVALAMALAFEPTEPDVMRRPPRRAGEPLLTAFLGWRILLVSLLFVSGVFGMFQWALWIGLPVEEARTLAVNTLVGMEVFYLFSVRYLNVPSLTLRGVAGTPAVLIAVGLVFTLQLVFTYAPFMNVLFGTRPVAFGHGLVVVAVGVVVFLVLEGEKGLRRRFMQ